MANSFTTNLVLTKPEVGADSNLWGGHLNGDLDILDGIFTSASTTLVSMVIKDDTKFVNATTTSKQIVLSLSSINTTTPRTISVPDFTGTMALQAMLRAHLSGLTLSAAGGTGTFGIAAGMGMDSTNVSAMILASAFTKTTSNWAVGTGNGGLDTSTIAASTWYHAFLIQRVDTGLVDVLFSLSATAPTMPANYTLFRNIGSMKTDGSNQWVAFTQVGDKYTWLVAVVDIDATSSGTSAVTRTLASVPTGKVVEPIISATLTMTSDNNGDESLYLSSLTTTDAAASGANAQVSVFVATGGAISTEVSGVVPSLFTNTSAQIRSRQAQGGSAQRMRIVTHGWIDRRGRDA